MNILPQSSYTFQENVISYEYLWSSKLIQTFPSSSTMNKWLGDGLERKGCGGQLSCGHLATIVTTLLILLYDQAAVERLFSLCTKNDTKFRASLDAETLRILLHCKINVDRECHEFPTCLLIYLFAYLFVWLKLKKNLFCKNLLSFFFLKEEENILCFIIQILEDLKLDIFFKHNIFCHVLVVSRIPPDSRWSWKMSPNERWYPCWSPKNIWCGCARRGNKNAHSTWNRRSPGQLHE